MPAARRAVGRSGTAASHRSVRCPLPEPVASAAGPRTRRLRSPRLQLIPPAQDPRRSPRAPVPARIASSHEWSNIGGHQCAVLQLRDFRSQTCVPVALAGGVLISLQGCLLYTSDAADEEDSVDV